MIKEVYKPNSLDETIYLLGKYGKKAKLIAGGTDLIIDLRNEVISPEVLIDISSIGISQIKIEEGYVNIGGGTTFAQIIDSPILEPNLHGLVKACNFVGSPQIRNRGTIGGNIVNNNSAADSVPPLIALNSEIIFLSKRGERKVKLEDYYVHGDEVGIRDDEVLVNITFKELDEGEFVGFSKLGLRKALAISRISMSIFINLDSQNKCKFIRVASGALGKYPMREVELENYLTGKKLNEKNIEEGFNILQYVLDERLKGRPTLGYKREAVKGVYLDVLNEVYSYYEGVRI